MTDHIERVVTVMHAGKELQYTYAKRSLFCPYCGELEVWEEKDMKPRIMVSQATLVCAGCDTLFTMPDDWDCNPQVTLQLRSSTIVFLNGEARAIHRNELSYEHLLTAMGYPQTARPSMIFKDGDKRGILMPGNSIQVRDGMRFNIDFTGNA